MAFIPLQEFAVIKYCTGYHVSGVEVRVHGKSGDFNHEIDVGVPELGYDIIFLYVFFFYREVFVAESGRGGFGNERNRFDIALPFCLGEWYCLLLLAA